MPAKRAGHEEITNYTHHTPGLEGSVWVSYSSILKTKHIFSQKDVKKYKIFKNIKIKPQRIKVGNCGEQEQRARDREN